MCVTLLLWAVATVTALAATTVTPSVTLTACLNNVIDYTNELNQALVTNASHLTASYVFVDTMAVLTSCNVTLSATHTISIASTATFIGSSVTFLGTSNTSNMLAAGRWTQRSNVSIGGSIGVLTMDGSSTGSLRLDPGSVVRVLQSTVVSTCDAATTLQLRPGLGPWLDLSAGGITMSSCDLTIVGTQQSLGQLPLPAVWFSGVASQQPYFYHLFNLTLSSVGYTSIGGKWGADTALRLVGVSISLSALFAVSAPSGRFAVTLDESFECRGCQLSFPQVSAGMLIAGLFNGSAVTIAGAAQPTVAGRWIGGSALTLSGSTSPLVLLSSLVLANASMLSVMTTKALCDVTKAGCATGDDVIRGAFLSGATASFVGLTFTMLAGVVIGERATVSVTERSDMRGSVVHAVSMRLVRVVVRLGGSLSLTSTSGVTRLTYCGVQFESGSSSATANVTSSLNVAFRGLGTADVWSFVTAVASTNASSIRLSVKELDDAPGTCDAVVSGGSAALSVVASLPFPQVVLVLNRCSDVVITANRSQAVVVIVAGSITLLGPSWYNGSSVTLVSVERVVQTASTVSFSGSSVTIASSTSTSCAVAVVVQGTFYNSTVLVVNSGLQQVTVANCTMVSTSLNVTLDDYSAPLPVVGSVLSAGSCSALKSFVMPSSVTIRGASQHLSYACTSAACSVPQFSPSLDALNATAIRTLTATLWVGGASLLQYASLSQCCGWSSVAVSVVGGQGSNELLGGSASWPTQQLLFSTLSGGITLQNTLLPSGVSVVLSSGGSVALSSVTVSDAAVLITSRQDYTHNAVTMRGSTNVSVSHSGSTFFDQISGSTFIGTSMLAISSAGIGSLSISGSLLTDSATLSAQVITTAYWDSSFTMAGQSTLSISGSYSTQYGLSFSSTCFQVASYSDVSLAISAPNINSVESYLYSQCGPSLGTKMGGLTLTSRMQSKCPQYAIPTFQTLAARRLTLSYNGCGSTFVMSGGSNYELRLVGLQGVLLYGTYVNYKVTVQCNGRVDLAASSYGELTMTGGTLAVTAPTVYLNYYQTYFTSVGLYFGAGTNFYNYANHYTYLCGYSSFTYDGSTGSSFSISHSSVPFQWNGAANVISFAAYDASLLSALFGTMSPLTSATLRVTSTAGATAIAWYFCSACGTATGIVTINSPTVVSIMGGSFTSLAVTSTADVYYIPSTISGGALVQITTSQSFVVPNAASLAISGASMLRVAAASQVTLPALSLSGGSSVVVSSQKIVLAGSLGGTFRPTLLGGSLLALSASSGSPSNITFPIQLVGSLFTGGSTLSISLPIRAQVSFTGPVASGSLTLSTVTGTLSLQGNFSDGFTVRAQYVQSFQLLPAASNNFNGIVWSNGSSLEIVAGEVLQVGDSTVLGPISLLVQDNSSVKLLGSTLSLPSVVAMTLSNRSVLQLCLSGLLFTSQSSRMPQLRVASVALVSSITLCLPPRVAVSIGSVGGVSTVVVSFQGPSTLLERRTVYLTVGAVISNASTVSVVNASTIGLLIVGRPLGAFTSSTSMTWGSISQPNTLSKSTSLSLQASSSESRSDELTDTATRRRSLIVPATATAHSISSLVESNSPTSLSSLTRTATSVNSATLSSTGSRVSHIRKRKPHSSSDMHSDSNSWTMSLSLSLPAVPARLVSLTDWLLVVSNGSRLAIVGTLTQSTSDMNDLLDLVARSAVSSSSIMTVAAVLPASVVGTVATLQLPRLSNNATVAIELTSPAGATALWPRIQLGSSAALSPTPNDDGPSSLAVSARGSVAYLATNFTAVPLRSLRLLVGAMSFIDPTPPATFAWLRGTAVDVTVTSPSTKGFEELVRSAAGGTVSVATLAVSSTCASAGECPDVNVSSSAAVSGPLSSLSLTVPLRVGVQIEFPQPFAVVSIAAATILVGGSVGNSTRLVLSSTAEVIVPARLLLDGPTSVDVTVPCAANAASLLHLPQISVLLASSNLSIRSVWCPLSPASLSTEIAVGATAFSSVIIDAVNESLWVNLTLSGNATALSLRGGSVTVVGSSTSIDVALSFSATAPLSQGGGLRLGGLDRLRSSAVTLSSATAAEWAAVLSDIQRSLAETCRLTLTASQPAGSDVTVDLRGAYQNASITFDVGRGVSDGATVNTTLLVAGELADVTVSLVGVRGGRLTIAANGSMRRSSIVCGVDCSLVDLDVGGAVIDSSIVVESLSIDSSNFTTLRPTLRFEHSTLTVRGLVLGSVGQVLTAPCYVVVGGAFAAASNVTLSAGAADVPLVVLLSPSSSLVGGSTFSFSPTLSRFSAVPTAYRMVVEGVVASSFVSFVSTYGVDCPSDALTYSSVALSASCVFSGTSHFLLSGLYWVANTNERGLAMLDGGDLGGSLSVARSFFVAEITTAVAPNALLASGVLASNWSTLLLEDTTIGVTLPAGGLGTGNWTVAPAVRCALFGVASKTLQNASTLLSNVLVFVSNTAASIPTAVVGSGHLVVVLIGGTGAVMPASVTTSLNLTNVSLVVGTAVDCALTVAFAANIGRHLTSKSASSSGGLWVVVASCTWNVSGVSRFRGLEVRNSALVTCSKPTSSNVSTVGNSSTSPQLSTAGNSTAILISSTNMSVTTAQYDSHAVLVFACNSSADGATRLITVDRSQIVLSATSVVDSAWTSAYIAAQWMAVYGLVASSVLRLPVACGLTLIGNSGIAVTTTVSANVTVRRTLTQSGGLVVADSTTVVPGLAVNTGASIVYVGGTGLVADITLLGWLTSSTDTVVVDGDGTVESVTFDGTQIRVLALQSVVTVGGGASGIRGVLSMTSATATCGSMFFAVTADPVMPRQIDVNYCDFYGVSSLLNATLITTASVDVNVGKSVVMCASKASSSVFAFLALASTSQIDVLLDGARFAQCGQITTVSQLAARNVSLYLRCVPWDTPTNYITPKQAAPYFSPFVASAVQFAGNSGNVTCVTGTLEPTPTIPSSSASVTATPTASAAASSTLSLTPSSTTSHNATASSIFSLSQSQTMSRSTSLFVSETVSDSPSPSKSSTMTASASATFTRSTSASLSTSTSHSLTESMTVSMHKSATRAVTLSGSASPSCTSSISDTPTITRSLTVSIDPCNTTFRSSPSAFLSSVAVAYPADGGPGALNMTDALFYTLDRVSFAAAEHIDIVVVLNTQLRNMYGVTSASWFPLPDVTDNCISGGYRIVNDTTFVMTLTYDSDVSLRIRRVSPYLCNVTFSTDVFQCQLMTNFTFNFSLAMLVTGTPENIDPFAEMVLRWVGLVGNFPQGPAVLQQSRFLVLMALADCQFSLVDELDVATHPLTFGFGSDQGYYLRGCVVGNIAFVLCLGLLMMLFLALYAAVASVVQGRTFREKFVYLLGRTGFPGILIIPIGLIFDGLVSSSVTVIVHPIDPQDKLIGGVGLGFSILILVGVAAVAIRVDGFLERRRVAIDVKLPKTHPLANISKDRIAKSILVSIKRVLRRWCVGVRYAPLLESKSDAATLARDEGNDESPHEVPLISPSALERNDDEDEVLATEALQQQTIANCDELRFDAILSDVDIEMNEEFDGGISAKLRRGNNAHTDLDWLQFDVVSRSADDNEVNQSGEKIPASEPPVTGAAITFQQPLPPKRLHRQQVALSILYKMFEPIMENRVALFVVVELLVSMVNAIVVGIGISKRPLCFKLSIVSCVSYFVYFVALITVRPSATRLLLATNIALSFLNFVAALLIVCSMAMGLVVLGDIAQQISFGASVLAVAQVLPTSLAIVAASKKYYIKKILGLDVSSEDDSSDEIDTSTVLKDADDDLVSLGSDLGREEVENTDFDFPLPTGGDAFASSDSSSDAAPFPTYRKSTNPSFAGMDREFGVDDHDILFTEMLARTQALEGPSADASLMLYELSGTNPVGDAQRDVLPIDWHKRVIDFSDEAAAQGPAKKATRKRGASVVFVGASAPRRPPSTSPTTRLEPENYMDMSFSVSLMAPGNGVL